MEDQPTGAILQRDKTTYAIVPRTPAGVVTPELLEKIAAVARKFDVPVVKITSGQRFALIGIKKEDVDAVWGELGMEVGTAKDLRLHYVQACPGDTLCKLGTQDSLGLGKTIERTFSGIDLPAKVKVGVSGCALCCAESFVRDIGVIGKKSGWNVVIGGCSAHRPRVGDSLQEGLSDEQVIALLEKLLAYYREHAKKRERMSRFVGRIGIEKIKEDLA